MQANAVRTVVMWISTAHASSLTATATRSLYRRHIDRTYRRHGSMCNRIYIDTEISSRRKQQGGGGRVTCGAYGCAD
eukprot:46460-Eustigmatos_ZCMA.PRE.1